MKITESRGLVYLAAVCAFAITAKQMNADESKSNVRVALFADPGSTDAKSREAIYRLLENRTDMSVDRVTTETVRGEGFLDDYDVFILPGGTGGGEARAIGADAGATIARRIREEGKGLVAICAGGYYVAQGWNPDTSALDVISAQNHDGKNWVRGQDFISVRVVGAADEDSSRTMWYENGPIFVPAAGTDLPDYVPLVKYVTDMSAEGAPTGQMTGRDAVIAAPYGEGRVVAFGPHPELSPQVNHWLINAIKWTARRGPQTDVIDAQTVLEGK